MDVHSRTRFVTSPHLVVVKHGFQNIVYHSLFGCPMVVNVSGLRMLNLFRKPFTTSEVKKKYEIQGLDHWLRVFKKQHYLITESTNERVDLKKAIDKEIEYITLGRRLTSLGLILDESCNFNCSYCVSRKLIQISKRSGLKPKRMSWTTAQNAVDTFVCQARKHNRKKLEVYFGGSEPLLTWKVLKKVVEYCEGKYGDEFKFRFSTNTNASLIDKEKASFLACHRVSVTSSLDGPRQANDSVRKDYTGAGTFTRIIAGWDKLGKEGRRIKWFCLTLTDKNIEAIDEGFFDFLVSRGVASCSIEPDLICSLTHTPKQVVTALLRYKKWGEARRISVGGLWCKPFKNLFSSSSPRPPLFNCSAFTGRGISVLPSGFVVPCSYSATKLGRFDDLNTMFKTKIFRALLVSRAMGNIKACRGCEIEGQCMGGCYLTDEFGRYADSQEAFFYRCEIYKRATRSLLRASLL